MMFAVLHFQTGALGELQWTAFHMAKTRVAKRLGLHIGRPLFFPLPPPFMLSYCYTCLFLGGGGEGGTIHIFPIQQEKGKNEENKGKKQLFK
jgi:hypothetical protein